MSHPYHHAQSSVRRFGGTVEDYLTLHQFLDSSKEHFTDIRHRAVLHNGFGIYLAEQVFGPVIESTSGRQVPTRVIAERHVVEDLGTIPTLADWLRNMNITPWMRRATPEMAKYRTRLVPDRGDRSECEPCG